MSSRSEGMAPLVLHLNGAPAVGKSTLAGRWAEDHPGTLLLDIDVLRTWVSGWQKDFAATGAVVRPVAIAMLAAYVAQGRDVVVPQLVANAEELARFRDAAEAAGARWVEVFVEADDIESRFATRDVGEPHLEAVRRLVADVPPDQLTQYAARLAALAAATPDAIRLSTRDGEIEAGYDALCEAVGRLWMTPDD